MNGWEITQIGLMVAGLAVYLAKHGEPKTGKWSFPVGLIATAIQAFVLYKAGLWH
ncbi:MAG: hypothetical protein BWY66_00561 [bacterium ADurb.Bin374]|nr:MAG: hypothetical protein BWY66_00561 [bacterium ADurb.Bin374]